METLQTEIKSKTEAIVDSDILELVPGFLESRKKDLQNLSSSLASDDFTTIAKISHTIKGIARPYGFPTLEVLIIQMEKAAKASDRNTCARSLAEINEYFRKYEQ